MSNMDPTFLSFIRHPPYKQSSRTINDQTPILF